MTDTELTLPKKQKKMTKSASPRFLSLADLLREAYDGKIKRLSLAKVDIEAMQAVPAPEGEAREQLLQLASSDRTLERSRELLLLCIERLGRHPLAVKLRQFVRDVLHRHPVYQLRMLDGVFENLPEAVTIEEALKALTKQSFSELRWEDEASPLKKSQLEALRQASVHCLLIWLRDSRGLELGSMLALLHKHCWADQEKRTGNDAKMLRTLMLSRDRKSLATVFSSLETQVADMNREVIAARGDEQRAKLQAQKTQTSLDEVNQLLSVEKARTAELSEQIQRLMQEHAIQVTHMRSDYEELRGRVLHRLSEEVILLDEGLHALRREPPKVHVMDDHAERAIDGLKKEIAKIRGDAA